jgi:hypothetical protein
MTLALRSSPTPFRREGFVDKVLEIVVVWPFVAALWGALLLAGGQVLYWLKFGFLPNLNLVWVVNRLNLEVPRISWEGAQKVFDWIASLPLAMTIAMSGAVWATLCIALINAFQKAESNGLARKGRPGPD